MGALNRFASALILTLLVFTDELQAQWVKTDGPYGGGHIRALAASGPNLIAGTLGGVFRSPNNGISWTAVDSGLTNTDAFAVSGSNLFAGTRGSGVFLSTDNGTDWTAVNSGLTNSDVRALVVSPASGGTGPMGASGTNLFAGTNGGGVFLSTNGGTDWTAVNTGLTDTVIQALVVSPASGGTGPMGASGTNLFAGTSKGVFLSTDNGTSWTYSGLSYHNVYALAAIDTNLFAGTGYDGSGGVYRSTDNGASWTAVNSGLNLHFGVHEFDAITFLFDSGINLFAGTEHSGVHLSTNNGTSWTGVNSGLMSKHIYGLAGSGTNLFAGTDLGVFLSTNTGTSWSRISYGLADTHVFGLGVSGTNLFAGTDDGVFLSTNGGMSWSSLDSFAFRVDIGCALAVSDTNVFVTSDDGIFTSTDNGTSWRFNGSLDDMGNWAVAASGTNVFVECTAGLLHYIIGGHYYPGIYYRCLAANSTSLFGGTTSLFYGEDGSGVFLSTNNGVNWTAINSGLTNTQVNALAANDTNLVAGTDGGVFLSTNSGTSWMYVDSTNWVITALAVSGTNLFAGTDGAVYRYSLTDLPLEVRNEQAVPSVTSLEQNYPNPFNPVTSIGYTVGAVSSQQTAVSSHVRLAVYDLLGREVAVLVDGKKAPGNYRVEFDGSNLSSGVYIYRLSAGDYVESKRMILLR
jgi:hypothetical protein